MDTLRRIPAGKLSEIIQKFVKHKRSLGYKYHLEEDLLYRFSLFSLTYEIKEDTIPKKLVEDWVRHVPGEAQTNQRLRSACMNVFLQFASDNGYKVSPPPETRRHPSLYVPYIFNEDEMARFFRACDSIKPYPGTNKHIIIPVIFRILYGCGLRVSEVSSLKCRDVDLNHGILVIRDAKFGKDRLIPMSDSLREAMYQYNALFNHSSKSDDFFFRSKSLQSISRGWIYRRFRDVLRESGIPHRGRGKGPRAHDLRHSFCVRSLKARVDDGMDVYCALPILATYVGHASVKATQGYVRLTVDMYPELIEKISKQCAYVIPEVMLNEAD